MGLATKLLVGSGVLIGIYLLVAHASEAGGLLYAAGGAGSGYARTLQGR